MCVECSYKHGYPYLYDQETVFSGFGSTAYTYRY